MKICIYAISKNEEQFVERFCNSAKDADLIIIADTGSTDKTIDVAKNCGAVVYSIAIIPWRFDHARNAALALVPSDIDVCVSLDLDEVLEPGWREEIEHLWASGITRLRYLFDWSSGLRFFSEKIHARQGYHWHHPVHEQLRADTRTCEVYANTEKLLVSHYPDNTKSRGQYLDLLAQSVIEDPSCPRNAFYYARELSYYHKWDEAIVALDKYLSMPDASWHHERSYAYRVKGKCYEALGRNDLAEGAYLRACAESPSIRDPWFALAGFYYRLNSWYLCFAAAKRATVIENRNLDYTVDPKAWGADPHDLAALGAHHLGLKNEAIRHGKKALEIEPKDIRLKTNLEYYSDAPDSEVTK